MDKGLYKLSRDFKIGFEQNFDFTPSLNLNSFSWIYDI